MKQTSGGLPPLKDRISRGIYTIFGLFGVFGFLLILAVFFSTRMSPRMIHLNYDSIDAAQKMERSWNAIQHPAEHKAFSQSQQRDQFESALAFAEQNITEKGELEAVQEVKTLWEQTQKGGVSDDQISNKMHETLQSLVQINEQRLFQLADESHAFGTKILVGSLLAFIFLTLLTGYISNSLASGLALPLRQIAETLSSHPETRLNLTLPEATSQEIQTLNDELNALWSRIGETDRLNLEQLVFQRNNLQTVLASIDDAVLVLASDGTITHHNSTLRKILGIDATSLAGVHWDAVPIANENFAVLGSYLAGPHSTQQSGAALLEFRIGSRAVTYRARRRQVLDEKNSAVGSVFMFRDVTEEKQQERLKREFIEVLSHELKTPLQSLSTASDLLLARKTLLPDDTSLVIDTIHEDVSRIRGVANDFIRASQMGQPFLRLNLKDTDLADALPQWIKPFQLLAKDKGVILSFEHQGSRQIHAPIDEVKFPWVLSNLLSNAIRVSPAESVVQVLLTDRNGAIELKVSDHGPGISPAFQSEMYKPFSQGSTDGQPGLLGIGLTIVKEVVEAHQGRVEFHPIAPSGSSFRVLLPFPTAGALS